MRTAGDSIAQRTNAELETLRQRLDRTQDALQSRLQPVIDRWRAADAELQRLLDSEFQALADINEELVGMQVRVQEQVDKMNGLDDLIHARRGVPDNVARTDVTAATTDLARKLDVSARELATLSKLLRTAEEHALWLGQVNAVLLRCPAWWALMPRGWQERKRAERLRRTGLFDTTAYLQRNPDVAAAGMAPLQHYLIHGHAEGRSR